MAQKRRKQPKPLTVIEAKDIQAYGLSYVMERNLGFLCGDPSMPLASVTGHCLVMFPSTVGALVTQFISDDYRVTHYMNLDSEWVKLRPAC